MKKLTKPVKRLITLAALLIVGFFFPLLMKSMPDFVESVFSEGVYVWVSTALGFIMSLVPFSIVEMVIFAALIAIVVLIILYIIRIIRRKATFRGFLQGVLTVLTAFAIALNAFYFTWGLNYYRPTLYKLMDIENREHTEDELYELCTRLIDDANSLREAVALDERGIFKLYSSDTDCFLRVREAYKNVGHNEPLLSRPVYAAKPVNMSRVMSSAGISGVFIPVFTEANVNVDQPDIALPFAAAHENAHYLGFARENEANFLAYMVCVSSNDADIRYSGTVNALMYCLSAASSADRERYAELTDKISDGVRDDLNDYYAYWDEYDGEIQDAVNNLNDGYLKFNSQESGVRSYGEMVDLMLAYEDARDRL